MKNPYSTELCHHGILGQKWGVRRYQNPDGSLTEKGKKKYYQDNKGSIYTYKQLKKSRNDYRKELTKGHSRSGKYINEKMIEKYGKETLDRHTAETNRRAKKGKKFVIAYAATSGAISLGSVAFTMWAAGGMKNFNRLVNTW